MRNLTSTDFDEDLATEAELKELPTLWRGRFEVAFVDHTKIVRADGQRPWPAQFPLPISGSRLECAQGLQSFCRLSSNRVVRVHISSTNDAPLVDSVERPHR